MALTKTCLNGFAADKAKEMRNVLLCYSLKYRKLSFPLTHIREILYLYATNSMWEKLKEAGGCKKYVFALNFRLFCKTAKGDYWLRHVCPLGTARLPLDGYS
jgi:hypothetical protein